MVRHWNRLLRTERDPAAAAPDDPRPGRSTRSAWRMTGAVLVVVLVTKFLHGAWIAIVAMVVHLLHDAGIRRHYDRVAARARAGRGPARCCRPASTRSSWSPRCTSRRCGRSPTPGRPGRTRSTAVTVNVDDGRHPSAAGRVGAAGHPGAADGASTRRTGRSPGRSSTTSSRVRRGRPRDVVTVFIPEYVVGHWWEHLLHNQTALRLKGRLLFEPGVMVTSVPWQLQLQRRKDLDRLRRRRSARGPASDGADARARSPRRRLTDECSSSTSGRSRTAGTAWPAHDGRVVFVRHALPGERVSRRDHRGRRGLPAGRRGRGARAPSPDRVEPPCPYAGPGGAAAATSSTSTRPPSATSRPPSCASSCARLGRAATAGGTRSSRCPVRRARLADPGAVRRRRRPAGPGCTSTARTRSSRSTGA